MPDQRSGVTSVRRQSFQQSTLVAIFIAALPIVIIATVWLATLNARTTGTDIYKEMVWLASNVGHSTLAGAGWIVPSLLAIVVGIYASDYGARRQLSAVETATQMSPDESRVLSLLNFFGAIIAAFTIDYFALGVFTIAVEGRDYGRIVGVAFVGVFIVVLALTVGIFAIRPPDDLLESNQAAADRVSRKLNQLGAALAPSRSAGASVGIVLAWSAGPILLTAAVLVAAAVRPNVVPLQVVAITGFAVTGMGLLSAVASCVMREARLGTRVDRMGSVAIAVSTGVAELGLVAMFVVVLVLIGSGWSGAILLAVGSVLVAFQVLVWWVPLRGTAASARWRRTPAAAHLELMRWALRRRTKRLDREREALQDYARELAHARRGRSVEQRRRNLASRERSRR